MPFSSKLKTKYNKFISNKLETIPISSEEDINSVAQELDKIITCSFFSAVMSFFNGSSKPTLAKETKKHLAQIRCDYNSPDRQVQFPADYAEYQQIIKERIQEKIIELRTFTDKEKKSYIARIHRNSSLQLNEGKSSKPDEVSVYFRLEEVDLNDVEDLSVFESKQSPEETTERSSKFNRSCSRYC